MWHRRLPPGSSGAEAWEPRTSSRSVSATGLRLQSSVPFRNTMSLLDEKDRPCFVRQSPDSASWKFFPGEKKGFDFHTFFATSFFLNHGLLFFV